MALKLDCPRREFSDAVSMAQIATSARSPQLILQNLKIEAKEGGIRVVGCDGEMWVERDLPCMVHEQGATCLQARLLVDLISRLPDGDLQLELTDQAGVRLTQGGSEYHMKSQDAANFPEPPDYGGEGELTLKMGDLRKGIDSVLYACSTDLHRPILTGVQFNYDGETLTLVATDTHRLAVRRMAQPGIGTALTAVVPERALRAIKTLPISDDEEITIRFGVGRLGVDAGGAKVVAQLISGAYPNWERVVPTEWTRTWQVESDQLVERVDRTMILAKDSANRVKFKGDGDQIIISARSEERGEAKEEVPMIPNNGDVEIAFNGRYVLDALKSIDGPGIRIELTENTRPAVFRPADDPNSYFCVIMPMALA
jgi:DNA polymerase-3 subunit beta